MWWANRRALAFWQAESLEELLAREYGSDSDAVRQRLAQVIENTAPGDTTLEAWTLYPASHPVTVLLALTPITIEDGLDAILIESSGPLDIKGDDEVLHLLEATRYTSLMVNIFSSEGQMISRNPAAAMGLDDRGVIEIGRRADLVVIDCTGPWRLVHTVASGAVISLGR